MRTLGIDLAAQPRNTGACVIDWEPGGARVSDLRIGVEDKAVLELIGECDKTGIDAPLGWPDDFVAALVAHRDGEPWPGRGEEQDAFRFLLSFRETDRRLIDRGIRRPLSVSTDLIGVVAMRAANLLDALAERGQPADRAGTGAVAEVYPAPALAGWGIEAAGYKSKSRGGAHWLPDLLEAIETQLGGLGFDHEQRALAETDHNCFDAIVCALVARAVALGSTFPPEAGDEAGRAASEGWIHLPNGTLAELLGAEGR